MISPDTNTLHPNVFNLYTTSQLSHYPPPVLWDFHVFKTNETAHATLNGSDEEKKFLKSSKGSPTYLRFLSTMDVDVCSTAKKGDVKKMTFSQKGSFSTHWLKKKEMFGTEIGYFSDENSEKASVVTMDVSILYSNRGRELPLSFFFFSLSLSLSSRFGTLISLSIRSSYINHGRCVSSFQVGLPAFLEHW